MRVEGRGEGNIPIVALPPNFIRPNLKNGIETVVTPGTISRMTAVSSGSVLVLAAIVVFFFDLSSEDQLGLLILCCARLWNLAQVRLELIFIYRRW